MFEKATTSETPGTLEEAVIAALRGVSQESRAATIAEASRTLDPQMLLDAVADHDNAAHRNAAIEALTRAGPRGIPTLVRALKHEDTEVVMFAAGILGKTRDATVIPHLVRLLDHDEINVAQAAIESLGSLRATVAVDALTRVLDKDPWLRVAAVHALGCIGDPRSVSVLVPLMKDELVEDMVTHALGEIGTVDALIQLAKALSRAAEYSTFTVYLCAVGRILEQQPAIDALARIPEWRAVSQTERVHALLLRALSRPTVGGPPSPAEIATREAAALVICALRMTSLYPTLLRAGKEPKLAELVEFCVTSIGEPMHETLRGALAQPDAALRRFACRCVGTLGATSLAPEVAELLGRDEETRREAIVTLAKLRHAAAVPAIAALLGDESEAVRRAAIKALSEMDASVVTQALLEHPQGTAAEKITCLHVMRANPESGQRPFIEHAFTDKDPEVRQAAVGALAEQHVYDFSDVLAPLLRDESAAVRREVIVAMGHARNPHVRELLLRHLREDPPTRIEAIRSLGELGDPTIARVLIVAYPGEDLLTRLAIVEALGDLGERVAEPLLVRLLGDPDAEIRRAAVTALGRFASPATLSRVVVAARDLDWSVRAAAVDAIVRAGSRVATAALERLCVDPNAFVAAQAKRKLEELEAS